MPHGSAHRAIIISGAYHTFITNASNLMQSGLLSGSHDNNLKESTTNYLVTIKNITLTIQKLMLIAFTKKQSISYSRVTRGKQ